MTRPTQKSQLDAALRALGNISVIPGIASAVDEQADAVLADLRETIVAEIPAFVESGNPDVLPELDRHTAEHAHEICRLCRGSMVGDFEFVRGYARHRAEHKFPLEAILHTYRCGHKIIASWLRKATLALDFADLEHRVVQYSDLPVRRLLVHLVGDTIRPALPPWADDFFAADAKARGSFTATLRAYADADMNLLQAAKALGVHPNTIYARMQKIADVTGMNALTYHALTELLLAADCRRQGITQP